MEVLTSISGSEQTAPGGLLAKAVGIFGARWSMLIIAELVTGPRRFGQLRSRLMGISANVLTQRLGELEANGVLERRLLPSPASCQVYALTDWGREADDVLAVLVRWAARSPDLTVARAPSRARAR